MKIKLLLIFLFLSPYSYGQDLIKNQNEVELEIHELTKEQVIKFDSEENALKKIHLIDKYEANMATIFRNENSYKFKGKVWSVDFDNESTYLILRLASFNEKADRSFFYNYRFNSEHSTLSNKIAELKRGDNVGFTFKFIDTVSRNSKAFRGLPLEKNPDTGNYVYLLFIELQNISATL